MIRKIVTFLKQDIWRIRVKSLSGPKSFLVTQLRVVLLAIRGFDEDKCQMRASALTFYVLLSIVPVVAMAFGVAKGFGLEKVLETQLIGRFPGQEEVIGQVIVFARSLLENTRGGALAGIGIAVLFWTVIKALGNIEKSFNDIWGIKEGRALGRRFSDYLSIMLVCPLLLIMSSSLTVFITTQVTLITEKISLLGFLSPLIFSLLKLLPYCAVWFLFVFIYIFMPNTRVRFGSGLLAGIAAGTAYQAVQWAYINFQVGMAKYNAIYGSFAALPLFLVWLQMSWLIVLLGAEISFAHQNVDTYEFEPDCLGVSNAFKELIAVRIAHLTVRGLIDKKAPYTIEEFLHVLEVPVRLLRQVTYELVQCGILTEVKTNQERQFAYQPARDACTITVQDVRDALSRKGVDSIPIIRDKDLTAISECLDSFSKILARCDANRLLKDI